MTMYKVSISKEFIEEADNETSAELEAIFDFRYLVDENIHTPSSILENLSIDSRPLTESEYKELELKNHVKKG
jgi:hypothetical protein